MRTGTRTSLNLSSLAATHASRASVVALLEAQETSQVLRTALKRSDSDASPRFHDLYGLPAVAPGVPEAPLLKTASSLGVACSAGADAMEIAIEFSDTPHVDVLTGALLATAAAGRMAVDALHTGDGMHCVELAHAVALAMHRISTALTQDEVKTAQAPDARHAISIPRSWRAMNDELGRALATESSIPALERNAAAAAHDGALHLMLVLDRFNNRRAGKGALCRYARVAFLAGAFAGWAACIQ